MAIFQCGTYSANQFGTSIAFSGARTIVLFSGQPWYHHSLGSQRADRRVAFYKKKTESCHEQYLGIVTQDEDPVIAAAICFPSFCLVHSPGELIRRGVHKVLKPLLMTSLRDGYRYQIGWSFGKKFQTAFDPIPLIFGKLCCKVFIKDMVAYMQGGMRARNACTFLLQSVSCFDFSQYNCWKLHPEPWI